MAMWVEIGEDERLETLRELHEYADEYPFIPVVKYDDEVRGNIELGNEDFIVDVVHWQGRPVDVRPPLVFFRRTKPWDIADVGYVVRCMTVDSAVDAVGYIVGLEREAEYIYFRVLCHEVPRRWRRSFVDDGLRELRERILEYERGRRISRDNYDT